jgi:hypothetical protein
VLRCRVGSTGKVALVFVRNAFWKGATWGTENWESVVRFERGLNWHRGLPTGRVCFPFLPCWTAVFHWQRSFYNKCGCFNICFLFLVKLEWKKALKQRWSSVALRSLILRTPSGHDLLCGILNLAHLPDA